MGQLHFSQVDLATVAYVEVDNSGTSTRSNSGVVTTKFDIGIYKVILPTNLAQLEPRDLILVQGKNDPGGGGVVAKNIVVDDSDPVIKTIYCFSGDVGAGATPPVVSTGLDSAFVLVILRTTISPPNGAPA